MSEENKFICPICLSAKKYFDGKKYKDCKVCDEEGKVNEEIHELYEGSDGIIS